MKKKSKEKLNETYKDVVREADSLQHAAFERARQVISERINSDVKKHIDKNLNEDEDIPDRVEDEEEEEKDTDDIEEMEEDELEEPEESDEIPDEEDELEEEGEEDEELPIEDDEEEDEMEEEFPDETEEDEEKYGNEDDLEEEEEPPIEDEEEEDEEKNHPLPTESKTIRNLKSTIKEQTKIINYLRKTINEVNLYNRKLLYATKLIDKYPLTRNQKIEIYEQFDNAATNREAKLIYEALKTSLLNKKNTIISKKKTKTMKEVASKTFRKLNNPNRKSDLILEDDSEEEINRRKKLAGIITI